MVECDFNNPQVTDAASEYHFANMSDMNDATILWHVF